MVHAQRVLLMIVTVGCSALARTVVDDACEGKALGICACKTYAAPVRCYVAANALLRTSSFHTIKFVTRCSASFSIGFGASAHNAISERGTNKLLLALSEQRVSY